MYVALIRADFTDLKREFCELHMQHFRPCPSLKMPNIIQALLPYPWQTHHLWPIIQWWPGNHLYLCISCSWWLFNVHSTNCQTNVFKFGFKVQSFTKHWRGETPLFFHHLGATLECFVNKNWKKLQLNTARPGLCFELLLGNTSLPFHMLKDINKSCLSSLTALWIFCWCRIRLCWCHSFSLSTTVTAGFRQYSHFLNIT